MNRLDSDVQRSEVKVTKQIPPERLEDMTSLQKCSVIVCVHLFAAVKGQGHCDLIILAMSQ